MLYVPLSLVDGLVDVYSVLSTLCYFEGIFRLLPKSKILPLRSI